MRLEMRILYPFSPQARGGSAGAKPSGHSRRMLAFAGSSAILVCLLAVPEAARPRYGGVLRVETQAAVQSLDPVQPVADPAEYALRARVTPLVFESLVG